MDKIAEIREALEKATPEPWKWVDPGGLERKKLVGEWEIMNFGIGGVYDQVAGNEPDEDDAHLIANAPEWLRFLLSELDREREENRKLREEREKWEKEARLQYRLFNEYHDESREKIEQLRAERDKLIEGLRWYADEDTHMIKRRSGGDYAPIALDHGKRARDILKEIGVAVE